MARIKFNKWEIAFYFLIFNLGIGAGFMLAAKFLNQCETLQGVMI